MRFNHLLKYGSSTFLESMDTSARLELLGSLCQMEANEENWLALRELFMTWPEGAEKKKAYAYANHKLKGWNYRTRCLTSTWGPLVQDKEANDFCILTRTIRFHRHSQGANRILTKLVESPNAAQLKCLIFTRSEIEEGGFKALCRSPYMKNLEMLEMHHLAFTASELDTLFGAKNLITIKTLRITHSEITGKEALHILKAPYAPQLEKLDLSGNLIKDKEAKKMVKHFYSSGLRHLNLKDNPVVDSETIRSDCSTGISLII